MAKSPGFEDGQARPLIPDIAFANFVTAAVNSDNPLSRAVACMVSRKRTRAH